MSENRSALYWLEDWGEDWGKRLTASALDGGDVCPDSQARRRRRVNIGTGRPMPRETLKQLMPSPHRLRRSAALRPLGAWVYESNLWHINRYSASMAFFVGLFIAFVPVPGQMPLAALAALALRCNLPLSVGLVWITNPITAPAIYFVAYQVGVLLLDAPIVPLRFAFSLAWLQTQLAQVWQPLLLGCLLCGLFFGSLGYFVVNVLWRLRVIRQWRQRRLRRAQGS